jgi:hypothetical protein
MNDPLTQGCVWPVALLCSTLLCSTQLALCSLNPYLDKRSAPMDQHEYCDTKQGAKRNGTHKMSAHRA